MTKLLLYDTVHEILIYGILHFLGKLSKKNKKCFLVKFKKPILKNYWFLKNVQLFNLRAVYIENSTFWACDFIVQKTEFFTL